MKTILFAVILILTLTLSAFVFANYARTMLVMDMRNAPPQLPKRFRMITDALPANINSTGLADLHIAGGGQFSKSAFKLMLERMKAKHIVVMDLRQESHGMLNDNAISWYGLRNADNANKTAAQIEEDQTALLTALGQEETVVVNKLVQKTAEGGIQKAQPTEYVVHQTSTEEELVTKLGHAYKRLYVQDYHAPQDKEVDRFIKMINKLSPDKWIYFHCRAGIGRTTVFMTMYDMMHNAKKVSLEDILTRQNALGGKDLRQLPSKTHFKYQWGVDRLKFITQFYEYARGNKDHFATSWTEWLKSQ